MTESTFIGGSDNPNAVPHPSAAAPVSEVVRGRIAIVIIVLMVLVADVAVYHAAGYFGPAVFFAGAVVLLFVGIPGRCVSRTSIILTVMLVIISWRLACNGGGMLVVAGLWLIHALVLALRRETPFFLETLVFAAQSIPGGYEFLSAINSQLRERVLKPVDEGKSSRMLDIGLPAVSAVVFAGIFVMANPDVLNWVSGGLADMFRSIGNFFEHFSPFETAFWCAIAWITAGLLRPVIGGFLTDESDSTTSVREPGEAPMYNAFRNTLITVITLFGVYLIFEFKPPWFQKLPEGFHYSGYAHQGAAWLTVALALATVMLSLIFRGLTLCDPRLGRLRKLAWIWSALNFVLAIAVYHRMLIYIDYNGMTRMRVVGLLGITSVVVGFALVMIKISQLKNFLWLIRRQLWIVSVAAFVFVVLPVDSLIHRYNVRQILNGNPAPIVQITEHPLDNEALPILLPLCEAEDGRIRFGMQAMLLNRLDTLQIRHEEDEAAGWTAWQKSTNDSRLALQAAEPDWTAFRSPQERNIAWRELKDFAFANWW